MFWICFRKTKIDTSFHQFTCLSKQCTGNYASRHISDWWNCKMNFTLRIFQLLPKIRKNNRGRGQPLLEECCDISGNKERFSALYFTNVLSTKWCSVLLYSLTSAVYAKLWCMYYHWCIYPCTLSATVWILPSPSKFVLKNSEWKQSYCYQILDFHKSHGRHGVSHLPF